MILHYIKAQLRVFVAAKKQYISNRAIDNAWTENRDLVLVTPIIYRFCVVYFLSHFPYDFRSRVNLLFFLLISCHVFYYWIQKRLKITVIVVWHIHVSCSVDSVHSQLVVIVYELSSVKMVLAFYKVLLYSSSRSNNAVHHFFLTEKSYDFSMTA